jgi:hypothetical protein
VWVDRSGNYRFREQNDRDGGREVVLYGRELSVALRYGKMIRRVAEEPEPSRLLEEALGAPFAVFDLVARKALVTRAGTELVGGARATVFELKPSDGRKADPAPSREGLQKWRNDASIDSLQGRVLVDDATGALLRCDLTAKFTTPADPKPVQGTVEVSTLLSEGRQHGAESNGRTPRIWRCASAPSPSSASCCAASGQARAAAEPPRPGGRPKVVVRPGAPSGARAGARRQEGP